ncbi:EscC/YscC/HrcC family type III secretion system outer membrane ring protein [Pseudomonas nabeulensis]|uniref:EscC/YscC/HrcC family type III secretion system outer membrane ring protein n=1 Tax=Pseudomonas nabeulensis TaxID=2293833 RepID=A0A4Z0B0Z4_9PSED|nr:type III secretion system outer membrane ring subunit SctC [Pseudomonas nabeulensis]TFY91868.1 EscC/YscC/HrcC family type III secretion system outer membrane ring protein [Pseudomonas nabeulensis]
MYAEFPATICRFWLLCLALLLGGAPAWGEIYQAQDESLHTVFTALSIPLGVPVVVSRLVALKRFSGGVDLEAPQQALEAVISQQDLIGYSNGQALYVYDASEAKNSAVALHHISVDRFRDLMRRAGIDESRYPLREAGGQTFYVSGPPNYVDQVLRLAQLMDRQMADLRVGNQAFGVVQVLNTHVADRQYRMGGDLVTVPGMASMIETLLAAERQGPLADRSLAVIAYPDTNSLLLKGPPEQVKFIEQLVAELDLPKRPVEVSLWRVDVERGDLKALGLEWDEEAKASTTRIMEPLEDSRLMMQIAALERRRRAKVIAMPVMLTQENVPAVIEDNHTFYLPGPEDDSVEWKPVGYGAQVSVLPRLAESNQIEMLINIEDGRQVTEAGRHGKPTGVGRVSLGSVVRVPQGKRLWLGPFQREERAGRSATPRGSQKVRLFVVQARAVGDELKTVAGGIGPPPLTAAQYERVQRAFRRPGHAVSP